MDHFWMYSLPSARYNGDILLLVDLSLLWSCQDAWFNESDLAVMGLCHFFPLLSWPLSPHPPRWPHLPFHVSSSDTDCKLNPEFQRCCVKWAHAGPELAVPRLLPVMVGDDGSQSSHTYSVAHQMDFLTQNAFKPGRSKQQHEPLSASRHSLGLKEKSKVLPSIWQQPDYRGEEHEEPDTGEGQRYPGEGEETPQLSSSILPWPFCQDYYYYCCHITQHPGFFTRQVKWQQTPEPAWVQSDSQQVGLIWMNQ